MPVFLFPIVQWIWANRKIVAEVFCLLLIVAAIWWFGIHNPRVIKELNQRIESQQREILASHAAINLLTNINKIHDEVDKGSAENETKIRTGRKPGVRGVFIASGMLPTVYATYSASSSTASDDGTSPVRPER
jgi:predicted PurR-regulated permease PerM